MALLMDKDKIAVEEEKARLAAAKQAEDKAAADKKAEEEASATQAEMDRLKAEKDKAIEEAANWKVAAMKAKKGEAQDDGDESDEERVARLVAQELSKKKVAEIETQEKALLEKTLKENKELKLAQLHGKKEPPAGQGSHSEEQAVQSTLVTAEQVAAFKARGWTDKDIERYKKNLRRYGN